MSQTKAQLIDAVDGSIVTADLADDAVNAAKLASNAVVNASVDASAAIAGTKISPDFGSQNVVTTGNITTSGDITSNGGDITISGASAILHLVDTNDNPNYRVQNIGGTFQIYDATSDVSRLNVNTDGHVDVVGNLDVGAGIDVTGNITCSGTIPAAQLTGTLPAIDGSNLTGIAGITINSNANNRVITATGNANSLNGESALTFDGATLDINGGSTDTPLTIDTTNTSGSHLRFRKDGTDKIFLGCGGGFALGDADDLALRTTDNIIFGVGTSEKIRIDSSGRLLIGTSTARAVGGESNPRLHIEGAGSSSNSWVNLTRFSNNNGSANIQFAKSRSGTAGTYTVVQNNDILGQISFLGADGTDMANYAALIRGQVDGTPGSNDMPGRIMFATTSDGGTFPTERMRIGSNGDITVNFDGSGNQTGQLLIADGTASAPGLSFWAEGSNDTGIFRSGANTLNFSTSGNERMRIDSNGSVVIGATSSNSSDIFTLHDAGNAFMSIRSDTEADNTFQILDFAYGTSNRSSSNLAASIQAKTVDQASGTLKAELQFYTNAGDSITNRMIIKDTGNVGIGTAEPTGSNAVFGGSQRTLMVAGSAAPMVRIASDTSNQADLLLQAGNSGADAVIANAASNGDLVFSTNNGGTQGTKIRFRHDGGINFGTDDATANALDDYEEGTFTPMSSTEASVYHARYTKIGNLCTINCNFEMKSGQSRDNISLPFEPADDGAGKNVTNNSTTLNRYAGTCAFFDGGTSVVNLMLFHQGNQGGAAFFLGQTSGGGQQWPKTIDDSDFGQVSVSFTYQVK
jgi:hypothetical protein